MSRLADYFVVVGYDHEKERGGKSKGIIVQRFPEKDWKDTPFIDGIEWFCQPQGWSLSSERQEPRFFVFVLTDVEAERHYCACLCFNETVSITPSKPVDEAKDGVVENIALVRNNLSNQRQHHSIMYAPKCLVLVSRLDYIETFRNCLGIIYTVYVDNVDTPIENLVGNMLGCIQVPKPGGPQVRFSIGAGDRQALQPPLSPTLPVTKSAVYLLFQELGIHNVVVLFCAVMTEHKVLLTSRSYTRLTEGCAALAALMYPFKYSHVYIPLLPAGLVEVLSTPTPFLMGVHASLKMDISEQMDVIVADLDGGSILVPDSISLPLLPEPLLTQTQDCLSLVLQPELCCADHAFPPNSNTVQPPPPTLIDKEVRAVFMRTFAQLLQGYRSCLTIIRIHPKPVITFHKAAFLGERCLMDDEFTTRVLDCMFFNSFVSERGPAWRSCDQWDELYCNMNELIRSENLDDGRLILTHIQELAQALYLNENPNPQPYVQKILKPPEGAFTRIHQPPFPKIDTTRVQVIINDGLAKNSLNSKLSSIKPMPPRIVPMGPPITNSNDLRTTVSNSARRLEVLRNCVNCIFENKISDARKTFPAVLRALKCRAARLALCTELSQHVQGNKAMLEHQQFDLVVRLMNCALQDGSAMDEFGVAAALLPLATAFCRKLCTGVIQFAYTCIQDHAVWKNQMFWESAYYLDVQRDIKSLYSDNNLSNQKRSSSGNHTNSRDNYNKDTLLNDRFSRSQESSALEIAAEQMRLRPSNNSDKLKEYISSEESTLYSQAIHYANRMVYLLVPLDAGGTNIKNSSNHHQSTNKTIDDERTSNSITNSAVDRSGSVCESDVESGFAEPEPNEIGNKVIKMVSRFVDKVCTEGEVSEEHIRSLHQMIPGVVHIHIETLDGVYRESKRLPPIQKPKILTPNMLAGEEPLMDGLRVYLLPDGREEGLGGLVGGPPLLPAEGAIFITNYRIVFKGTPLDPFACEQIVVRAFPVTSLTKEKRITVQYLAHLDQWLQEGHQFRSCTFQLIKVAFDEEVNAEDIECFRKFIHKVRHPPNVFNHFAFTGQVPIYEMPMTNDKEKNATLRGFAKKTLMKTARKAGFKQKSSSKRHKYVLPNLSNSSINKTNKYMTTPGRMTLPPFNNPDDISVNEFDMNVLSTPSPVSNVSDPKTLERVSERSYVRDWIRLGLAPKNTSSTSISQKNQNKEPFKITTLNSAYLMCRSYPALWVVPSLISDDSIRRFYRNYRHSRVPIITWRHQHTSALLLRGAGYHGKNLIGMFKSTHPSSSGALNSETSSSIEQERYLSAIVASTPLSNLRHSGATWGLSDSSLSLNSFLLGADEDMLSLDNPRGSKHLSKSSRGQNRSSGNNKAFGRWGSVKDRNTGLSKNNSYTNMFQGQDMSIADQESNCDSTPEFHRAALYILGDKTQMKGMKGDSIMKIDFIPVEYADIRHSKTSFKKLMRACMPSSASNEPEHSFYKMIESSDWLQQLRNIMQLSGAIVDLIDVQGSSVMLCLEEGWDITCQLSSIAQLCMDPYYRTIEGFRILIEKEWLAFGHRFSHRSNLATASQASGFAPTFLQFLDIVHQIHSQFPLSFEFNDYYLRFLAYHSVSCRFRTFLLDCELERVECGVAAVEDKRGSLTSHHKNVDTGSDDDIVYPGGRLAGTNMSSHFVPNLGQSIFDYIEKHNARTSIFYNFMYMPNTEQPVLRPQSSLPNLNVWQYYLKEELAHGPSYDLEIIQMDMQQEEEAEAADGISRETLRKVITTGYHIVERYTPDAFKYLLDDIHKLETELGLLPQKWKVLWDKLDLPKTDSLKRHASFSTQLVRSHGRLLHKRSTLEILMRGKVNNATSSNADMPHSHPHRFEKYNFTTPTYCDFCSSLLWGPVKTGMRCCDCGYSCHEKCSENVPKGCTKYKAVSDRTLTNQNANRNCGETASVNSNMNGIHQQYYEQFSSNVAENRTHEGYLYKRGALLKAWKQRWFVLDSIKHQLRYYDSMDDSHCKGYIDLAEVMSVSQANPSPGAPKKTDDKSFFDLRTNRRTYNFCASDMTTAQEWIEKVQACLQ
ncbi:myotubularin-related protein 13 [Adelges cooleyi]|uniref:myotubularin-related protein 13 n=1 Tax=Adelges cooleyi TaxID=133065 RepID=UPI00217FBECF|nr:myotubularin-related protein 13 [Adelges cooleyi]